jgi:predicted ATPase
LKEGSLTASEVAYQVGFGSPAYFSKCYRDHFGFLPSETSMDTLPEEATDVPQRVANRELMHNFPVQTTSFIGREKEIETILSMIENHRIVSLIGTGGSGKTRLASEVVKQCLVSFEDGIWFVDLAPVESEELVLKQIMSSLEIAENPGRDLMEVVIDRIREKNLLILLDNCEHLLGACTEISGTLIGSVPGLHLLVTSREALKLHGEKVWEIPPLTLIDPASINDVEHAKSAESVRLFSERAQLQNPGFELASENVTAVATICQKVDGIPLAIELVASRTRHLDTSTLLDRLGERFAELSSPDPRTVDRQKNLLATIEWSHKLLKENERALFRKLSVFTGGFDLQAVEEVCTNESLPKESILDLLSRLIDTCLIQATYKKAGQMRYRMLETLRQFAMNQLINQNEADDISKKHLAYFTSLADQSHEERMSAQAAWMEKLYMELNNILAALRWSEMNDQTMHSRLAGSISWFWARSNHYSTATEILERNLSFNNLDKESLARIVSGYGTLLLTTADIQKGLDLLKRGLSLWHELRNSKEEALVLAEISNGLFGLGENDAGLEYAKKGFALAGKLGDPGIELYCMLPVGMGLVVVNNTKEARSMAKSILKLAEELNHLFGVFAGHHFLGDCSLIEGKYEEGESEYGKGMEATLKYNDTSYTCMDMLGVAMSVAGQGRYAKALRINAAAASTAKSYGFIIPEELPLVFWQELIEKHIRKTRKKLGEDLTYKYEEEGRYMSFEEAVEYALDFDRD